MKTIPRQQAAVVVARVRQVQMLAQITVLLATVAEVLMLTHPGLARHLLVRLVIMLEVVEVEVVHQMVQVVLAVVEVLMQLRLLAQEQVVLVHQVKETLVVMVVQMRLLIVLEAVVAVQAELVVTTLQAQAVMDVLELLIQFQVLP
jgi:hypothetical protein